MSVLDWTLSRKKKSLSKFYKIDVISMTDEDSFAAAAPERRAYGTLRKIKSLNDLLENDVDDHSNISKTTSGEISKPSVGTETQQLMMRFDEDDDDDEVTPLTSRKPRQSMAGQNGSTEGWVDQLRQRGDKKPTGQFIVSGFSTLSRRAGGGEHSCSGCSPWIARLCGFNNFSNASGCMNIHCNLLMYHNHICSQPIELYAISYNWCEVHTS